VLAEVLAVVGGEDEQRVFEQAFGLHAVEELAQLLVIVANLTVVQRDASSGGRRLDVLGVERVVALDLRALLPELVIVLVVRGRRLVWPVRIDDVQVGEGVAVLVGAQPVPQRLALQQ
jgi:hypothetical protein